QRGQRGHLHQRGLRDVGAGGPGQAAPQVSRTATAIGERMGTPSEPGPDRPPLTHTETAMGTVFSLTLVPGYLPGPELRPAVAAACATLHRADAILSTWDAQSPVSRLRRG